MPDETREDGVSAFEALAREISRQLGSNCEPEPEQGVSGGSAHRCYLWRCGERPLFVKVAEAAGATDLEAEAQGLTELAAAEAVRVPKILARGLIDGYGFLALEWIDTRPAGRERARCPVPSRPFRRARSPWWR